MAFRRMGGYMRSFRWARILSILGCSLRSCREWYRRLLLSGAGISRLAKIRIERIGFQGRSAEVARPIFLEFSLWGPSLCFHSHTWLWPWLWGSRLPCIWQYGASCTAMHRLPFPWRSISWGQWGWPWPLPYRYPCYWRRYPHYWIGQLMSTPVDRSYLVTGL